MPVTEISGVTAIPGLQQSGLEQFANAFLAGRQARRSAAERDLEAATQIASYDPVLAEEIGGKAVKELGKAKGQNTTEMYFKNIYDAAQQKRQQETSLTKSKLDESQANIEAIKASTDYQKQQTKYAATHEEFQGKINDAEKRLMDNKYEDSDAGKAERQADARIVGIEKKLTPDVIERMGMTPAELKELEDMAATDRRNVHAKMQLDYAETLSDMAIQLPNGKSRPLTPDEINATLQGKPPQGLTSQKEFIKNALDMRQVAAQELNAQANMMEARSRGKLTDAQIEKLHGDYEKDLAQADALRKKGIKTSYDDLLKSFEALRQLKLAGGKPDKSLEDKLQTEMAAWFGGTPEETKGWLGEMELRGFNFKGTTEEEGKPAKALDEAVPKKGAAYRAGQAVVKAPVQFQKGIESFEVDTAEGLVNFISGMLGGAEQKRQPLTDDQLKEIVK
jgi:hypothetical protein